MRIGVAESEEFQVIVNLTQGCYVLLVIYCAYGWSSERYEGKSDGKGRGSKKEWEASGVRNKSITVCG